MSAVNIIQDELLDGFCRGCLNKYDDPAELLHYTEKNRRLFVYSTGIQVKRNDTFTFQLCKDCYISMKMSCKFKKLCRSSDRRFKSYLRLNEVGEGTDLLTFLRQSAEEVKFPLLSGHSTPAHQKRDDDNESTCTSIRNFMTDILQGEEMADSEARIIKEVIEEEADLEDSLDSHWLQDDTSVDSDFKLDFSFSPYVTPRFVNSDHRFTPIRQIEPSLRCRNNHAKKVLLQLPTRYTNDDPVKTIESSESILLDDCKENCQLDHNKSINDAYALKYATEDSIAELIEQNEDFLIRDDTHVLVKSVATNALEIESVAKKHACITIENGETESQEATSNRSLTENDIAVKSISLNTFGIEQNSTFALHESDTAVKNIDVESRLIKDKYNLIETNNAVKSISMGGFGIKTEEEPDQEEYAQSKNHTAVKIVNLSENPLASETDDNKQLSDDENYTAIKSITINPVNNDQEGVNSELPHTEEDIAVQSIITNDFENNKYKINEIEVRTSVINIEELNECSVAETNIAVKSIKANENINLINDGIFEEVLAENQEDPLFIGIETLNQDKDVNKQYTVDTIDKNLEEALKNQSNKDYSLDDLLVSPARDSTPVPGFVTPIPGFATPVAKATGISTPTINNILFGEKLDDESNSAVETNLAGLTKVAGETNLAGETKVAGETNLAGESKLAVEQNGEIDILEDFFTQGVKDFEPGILMPPPELPLELKYDLPNGHCMMCNKKFDTSRALKIHLNKVHLIKFPKEKKKQRTGICSHCGKVFDSTSNLARHVRTHIQKFNEEFKCDVCQLTFLSEYKFKSHLRGHDGSHEPAKRKPDAKKYVCNICGVQFNAPGNFNMHMRRHTKKFTYKCEVCDKGFYRNNDLNIHFKRRHSAERPYKCVQCGASFPVKYTLVTHMRTHADQKTFECYYCGQKFATKIKIAKHIHESKTCIKKRNKPKGPIKKKPKYKCLYCPMKFHTKYHLVKHENTSACWEIIKVKLEEMDAL